MINSIKAYSALSEYFGGRPSVKVCKEYDDAYIFILNSGGGRRFVGGLIFVDRSNGKVYDMYAPEVDSLARGEWKNVDVSVFKKYQNG